MASERYALVTGGGSGVGKATALALTRAGWRVAVTGRRRDKLEEAAREIGAAGRPALAAPCDIGDPAAVKGLFETVEREFRRLDLLFNNAGQGAPVIPIDELTFEQWKSVVDVNLQRHLSVRPGRLRADEAAEAAGRADHQ